EAVARAVVAVELVILAVLLELGLMLVHLLRTWRAILIPEKAEQRTGQILREIDRCNRRLGVQVFLGHGDTTDPEIDAGIDILLLTRVEERVPTARAGTEDTDLAIMPALSAHPFHRGLGISDDLRVRHATFGTHLRRDVIGIALTIALIEVRANGDV